MEGSRCVLLHFVFSSGASPGAWRAPPSSARPLARGRLQCEHICRCQGQDRRGGALLRPLFGSLSPPIPKPIPPAQGARYQTGDFRQYLPPEAGGTAGSLGRIMYVRDSESEPDSDEDPDEDLDI